MSTNDKLLPLWYQSNTLREEFVIGRPSSLRNRYDSLQGVFEYQLFPIYEKDADMLLFNTVWDLVMHPDFYKFYDDSNIINEAITFSNDVVFHRPYLLFPSDDPRTNYEGNELEYPYIVGVFSENLNTGYPLMGFEEGDEYPMFRLYLTPEWYDQHGESDVVYRMHHRSREDRMPLMINNAKELKNVLGDLIRYLKSVNFDTKDWINRLQTSLKMLNTDTNELFILHNAGLYDIQSLWALLMKSGSSGEEVSKLYRKVECELHRFAMMIVNLMDWKKGGMDSTIIISSIKENEYMFSPLNSSSIAMCPTISSKSSSSDNHENSVFQSFLPDYWWNDIGVMEKAFK